jgi:L-ribulose-5-phosphate 3-epimerase UlaE
LASLKDAQQLTDGLDDLVGQLRSELGNGSVDFEKLVGLADQLSEQADGLAETFSSVNQTLMQRLDQAKKGSRGAGSSRQGESKSEAKTARS